MAKEKKKRSQPKTSVKDAPEQGIPVSSTKQVDKPTKAIDLVSDFLKKVPEGKHFNVEVFSNQDGSITFHSRTS